MENYPSPQIIGKFDKLNYASSETAKITIEGPAKANISVLIIDPGDKVKLTETVTLGLDGSKNQIASSVAIQHYEDNPFDFLVEDYAVIHPFDYALEEQTDLAPFRQAVYPGDQDAVQRWLDGLSLQQPMETFALLDRMNREIASRFFYQIREEQGVQPPALTLARNSGSCRDFAALLMEACRHLGLASRFVSGYLFTSDFDTGNGSTHAWAEVYLPGAGWKGFDPTSGEVVGNRHIATAVARHPESVPPVAGSFIGPGGSHPMPNVTVRVSTLAT